MGVTRGGGGEFSDKYSVASNDQGLPLALFALEIDPCVILSTRQECSKSPQKRW